jgi:hypothetical protein
MGEPLFPTDRHAAMPARRLQGDLRDTIRELRCTLTVTDSQSTDDRPASPKFDPSEPKPLTSDQ